MHGGDSCHNVVQTRVILFHLHVVTGEDAGPSADHSSPNVKLEK